LYGVAAGVAASLTLAGGLASIVAQGIRRRREEEARRTTAALMASEERGALAIDAAEFGTWEWDLSTDRVEGSERCGALMNLPPVTAGDGYWPSALFLAAVHPADRERVRATARQLGAGQAFDVEFRVTDDEGAERWMRARGRPTSADQNARGAILGVIGDVTQQKHAERERLEMSRRLSDVQEAEQRRIARELHDQVGQTVTGLSLGLKALEQSMDLLPSMKRAKATASGAALFEQIRWLQRLAGEIGRDIHRAAADLRPTALDDLGLPGAVAALAADWSERYGISADVQSIAGDEGRLPGETETVAYRVVQEALTNVLKHAEARYVSIVLERRPHGLRMVIEDDGVGFDADTVARGGDPAGGSAGRRRLGLSLMRERLAGVGGTLATESAPGAGTSLFVHIPLPGNPEG
jgi:signal transduction histidine kinase